MKENKYTIKYTNSFKKDYKRAIKRGLKIELLNKIAKFMKNVATRSLNLT